MRIFCYYLVADIILQEENSVRLKRQCWAVSEQYWVVPELIPKPDSYLCSAAHCLLSSSNRCLCLAPPYPCRHPEFYLTECTHIFNIRSTSGYFLSDGKQQTNWVCSHQSLVTEVWKMLWLIYITFMKYIYLVMGVLCRLIEFCIFSCIRHWSLLLATAVLENITWWFTKSN